MKKTNIFFLILSIALFASCSDGFKKTKTGLKYKIIPSASGEKLLPGDLVKFQYKVTYKDSVVQTTYGTLPAFDMVDATGRHHDFSEVLSQLKVGDSLVTIQRYDSLSANPAYGVPRYLKKGETQQSTLKIMKVYKADSATGQSARDIAFSDYEKEVMAFKDKEIAEIEKYLTKNNINAEKINNNFFIEVKNEGNGPKADSGKIVGINYSGAVIGGRFFDSNVDKAKQARKHNLDTFYFVSKESGAIQGLLEAITLFKVGTKANLYIPSLLAYGPQGTPPVVKPYQNLMFEIELVSVKDKTEDSGELIENSRGKLKPKNNIRMKK
jgi:FKBP-type peptidyl-prolyl cis-trans isomerase